MTVDGGISRCAVLKCLPMENVFVLEFQCRKMAHNKVIKSSPEIHIAFCQ